MRIMLIRSGAVGDTILLLPFLRCMEDRHSPVKFTLAGQPERLGVIASQLDAASVIDLDGSFAWLFTESMKAPAAIRSLLKEQDWVIRFSSSPGDEADSRLRAMGDFRFDSIRALPGPDYEKHSVFYPFDALGIEAPVEEAMMQGFQWRGSIRQFDRPTLAFAPGAGSASKRWPVEGWERVLGELKEVRRLMILGPAEQERASGEMERLGRLTDEVLRRPALVELALMLSGCRAFVGCDSGITHLAAMVGIPTLALFGPSDPCRWGPVGRKAFILLSDRLMVFPEWLRNSPGTCPPAGLEAISPGAVVEWIQRQVTRASNGES